MNLAHWLEYGDLAGVWGSEVVDSPVVSFFILLSVIGIKIPNNDR
jgi:hypothetical protein